MNKRRVWWDEECKETARNRNKAFQLVKRTPSFQHLIEKKKERRGRERTEGLEKENQERLHLL